MRARILFPCSRIFTSVVLAMLLCAGTLASAAPEARRLPGSSLAWYDVSRLDVEGRGWNDTASFYDRLPACAEGVVPGAVWNLSHDSAGMCVRFITDATEIAAHWTLRDKSLSMPHMPATGVSGLDLYVLDHGRWRWARTGIPRAFPDNEAVLVSGLSPEKRTWLLYLPLYNGVTEVLVGLPDGARLEPAPAYPRGHEKPIVFWGTSVTQGGCASRPGMAFVSILGRRLDRPTINLGFSGNGKMQPEMVALMAELDPAVFVIDCVANMDGAQVRERAVRLVHALRAAHPRMPIVLAEDRTYPNAYLVEERRTANTEKRAALREAYRQLRAEGVRRLYYLAGDNLLSRDGEDTVDGSHPTDLGMAHMADTFEPALRRALRPR